MADIHLGATTLITRTADPGHRQDVRHADLHAWWTHYLTPLAARFPMLLEKYAGDEAALAIVDEAVREDQLRREHPDIYSHEYIVARPA